MKKKLQNKILLLSQANEKKLLSQACKRSSYLTCAQQNKSYAKVEMEKIFFSQKKKVFRCKLRDIGSVF
jgi:hypothetical protein